MAPLLFVIKAFLCYNSVYQKYYSVLNLNFVRDNNKELYKLLKVLPSYKEKHPDGSNFALYFFSQYPGMKPDEAEIFIALFDRLEQIVIKEEEVNEYLDSYKRKEMAVALAMEAISFSEGRGSKEKIIQLTDEFKESSVVDREETFVTDDLEEIYAKTLQNNGLRWRLNTLNKMLGSLRRGNFGFIFARPETGKTTFLADQCTFFAGQMDSPALWVNNEEDGAVVKARCYQAALGISQRELYQERGANKVRYTEATKNNIKLLDDANANRKQIELLCSSLKPGLIIFDQIDKIRGFEEERYDLKMKEIYRWARGLAKIYGPVIGVCQAGGSAEGKKWLTMTDVDSSYTAKQGEADFILGIGKVADDAFEGERYLHLSKNKLPGDEDSIASLRHGKVPVGFKPEIARYEDKVKW